MDTEDSVPEERVLDIVRPEQHAFPVHIVRPTAHLQDILLPEDRALVIPFALWSVVSVALYEAFQRHTLYNVPVLSFRLGHKSTLLALRRLEDICAWHAALEDTPLNRTRVERLLHYGTRRLRVRARERSTVRAIARSIEAYSFGVGVTRARHLDNEGGQGHESPRVFNGGMGDSGVGLGCGDGHTALPGDASADV